VRLLGAEGARFWPAKRFGEKARRCLGRARVREVRPILQCRDALVQDAVPWENRAEMAGKGSDPVKALGETFRTCT